MRLGIDLGTGSLKLMAIGPDGHQLGISSRPYRVLSPSAGAAETDVEEWVEALREAWIELSATLAAVGLYGGVDSVGLSAQMHGLVPVAKNGRALRPAILWADSRGAELLSRFEGLPAEARARLMNAPATGMAALIIMRLMRDEPALYHEAECFLFPKDYLRLRLTGVRATDPGDASAGLLYDFVDRTWSHPVLDALGIDPEKLPPIRDAFDLAGTVSPLGAIDTGLPQGVPVAIGSSDAACALFGSGLFNDILVGDHSRLATTSPIQISVGSGAQVLEATRRLPPYDPALNCYESAVDGVRYRMAAMLNGGVALEWVRAAAGVEWDAFYKDLEAGRIPLPEDLIFLPYLTGERCPYGDSAARGAWIGLGLHHDRQQLLAAALLGVACSVRLGLETLGATADRRSFLIGGSARRGPWRKLLASVLRRPLELCDTPDASARGAALIGGAAAAKGDSGWDSYASPPPITERVVPGEAPWLDRYFARFRDCYAALYGEDGAYARHA